MEIQTLQSVRLPDVPKVMELYLFAVTAIFRLTHLYHV